jgi:hypothetical protein
MYARDADPRAGGLRGGYRTSQGNGSILTRPRRCASCGIPASAQHCYRCSVAKLAALFPTKGLQT